jgi:hypothetical protein
MNQTPDKRIVRVLEEIRDKILREIDDPMAASSVKPAAPGPIKICKRRKFMRSTT